MCTGVSSGPPQRRHGWGRMATPESRFFRTRSLRCTGVLPSLARSARSAVVGGRRGEVPGVDIGCGVGRAQRCVSSVRQRMVRLCLLRNRAERSHRGGP